jgi:hypothetical protein
MKSPLVYIKFFLPVILVFLVFSHSHAQSTAIKLSQNIDHLKLGTSLEILEIRMVN